MNFRLQNQKQGQAEQSRDSRQRAIDMHLHKTKMQGKKMVYEHIGKQVEKIVPEQWRMASRIILPGWYDRLWARLGMYWMNVALFLFQTVRFLCLYNIQRRIARIVFRGGCTGRVSQVSEWVVKIRIFRWFKCVYQCDMDVRNGRVMEVFAPKETKGTNHGEM